MPDPPHRPLAHGGVTAIDNLAMLCTVHHRLVHHSGWTVHIAGGRPEFVPPGWIDPSRRPRRQPDPNEVRASDLDPPGTVPAPRTPETDTSGASGADPPAGGTGSVRVANLDDLFV